MTASATPFRASMRKWAAADSAARFITWATPRRCCRRRCRFDLSALRLKYVKNLPMPDIVKFRSRSYRAIFWFKSEAEDCISRIWEMAHLLEYHGYLIEMQKCRRLGNIIYEDKFQVAAIPSKDDKI